ncbi:hypothetical protein D3C72_2377950 [compost metagenome]
MASSASFWNSESMASKSAVELVPFAAWVPSSVIRSVMLVSSAMAWSAVCSMS